jgi:phosphoserine phosphatase
MNNIALFDWDGTLVKGFSILEWMKYLSIHFNTEESINELNNQYHEYLCGGLEHDEFCNSSAAIYLKFMESKNVKEINTLAMYFVREQIKTISTDVPLLFYYLRAKRIKPFVLSGAPFELLRIYSIIYNFKIVGSLKLETTKGYYNGKILYNSGLTKSKKNKVDELLEKKNKIILGFGNSKSDFPILENSQYGHLLSEETEFDKKFILVTFDNFFDIITDKII